MHHLFRYWFRKTRPATTRFKFIIRRKYRFACCNIYINTWLEIIPIFITKRAFSMFILSDGILQRCQFRFEFCISRFRIIFLVNHRFICFGNINMAITIWIFLQIILMIFFRYDVIFKRLHLNLHWFFIFDLKLGECLFDHRFICLILIINPCAILSATIITLFV